MFQVINFSLVNVTLLCNSSVMEVTYIIYASIHGVDIWGVRDRNLVGPRGICNIFVAFQIIQWEHSFEFLTQCVLLLEANIKVQLVKSGSVSMGLRANQMGSTQFSSGKDLECHFNVINANQSHW